MGVIVEVLCRRTDEPYVGWGIAVRSGIHRVGMVNVVILAAKATRRPGGLAAGVGAVDCTGGCRAGRFRMREESVVVVVVVVLSSKMASCPGVLAAGGAVDGTGCCRAGRFRMREEVDCVWVRDGVGCDWAHGRVRLCRAACRAARSEERTTFLC